MVDALDNVLGFLGTCQHLWSTQALVEGMFLDSLRFSTGYHLGVELGARTFFQMMAVVGLVGFEFPVIDVSEKLHHCALGWASECVSV